MGAYIALAIGWGFTAAVLPGPFQAYLLSQALRRGWRASLPLVFTPLCSDGPIIAVVLLLLSRLPAWWLPLLRIVGGAFVLTLAWGAFRSWRNYPPPEPAGGRVPRGFWQAVLINLLNPNPYISWSLVTGPILLQAWREAPLNGMAFLAGFYGTFTAGTAGVLALGAGAGRLGPGVGRALLGISALVLAGFGLYQVCAGLLAWFPPG